MKEGETLSVNGTAYQGGELISYHDRAKLTAEQKGQCNELASIREVFDFWVSLATGKDASGKENGNKISPNPNDNIDSTMFTNQRLAMYVEGRYMVPEFRRDCKFNWDVAPLALWEGGVEAGHSGSMCISMSKNSKNKDAAFELIEYLSGPEGQKELMKTGFNVPNQKSIARSDAFLVSDQPPYNNAVFVRAAEVQRGGDWTYLPGRRLDRGMGAHFERRRFKRRRHRGSAVCPLYGYREQQTQNVYRRFKTNKGESGTCVSLRKRSALRPRRQTRQNFLAAFRPFVRSRKGTKRGEARKAFYGRKGRRRRKSDFAEKKRRGSAFQKGSPRRKRTPLRRLERQRRKHAPF